MRPLQNAPVCSISVSGSNFNPRNTQCIPACPVGPADRTRVVKIIAFLELKQKLTFFEGLLELILTILFYILQLLSYFFKIGLYLDDNMGNICIVRLRPHGVEFTIKLLHQKIKFSAGRFS